MAGSIKDLQALLDRAAKEIPDIALQVMRVEALNHIKKNFKDQGFNDENVSKWKARKTTDRKGRDLTRYRTNRVGTMGDFTKFGKKELNRNILIGHNTGGDKLWNSYRAKKEGATIRIYTYKPYAQRHNEGLDGMPKRQHVGPSRYLDDQIKKKITKELDKLFK